MNILFGATGRLGRALSKKADILVSRKKIKGFEQCDYSNECLKKLMKGAERIIIATGSTKTYDKKELWKANVEVTKKIVENAPKNSLIVLASSIAVYGKDIKGIVDEKVKINPDSEYAKTKAIAEQIVEKRNGLILRLGTLYGEQFDDYYYVLRLIEKKKMPIIGNGKNNIPFTYVEDVVGCFFKDKTGIYNVVGTGASQEKILSIAAKYLGVKEPKKKVPYWIAYAYAYFNELFGNKKLTREHINILAKDRRISNKKAKKELGFKETEIEEGIKKMVRFYRNKK